MWAIISHIIVCVLCVCVCFSQNGNKQPRNGGCRLPQVFSEPITDIWVPCGTQGVIVVETRVKRTASYWVTFIEATAGFSNGNS